jgi:predicted phage terminase large subunit-like protein
VEANESRLVFRAQKGAQTDFLSCEADIVGYGGAAGGGKTYGVLLQSLRGINNAHHRCLIFRRTTPQITAQGGLWDESQKIFTHLGGDSNAATLKYKFKSGATIKFGHLQHLSDIYDHQGDQANMIIFDELTHFLQEQFWYMLSRNRNAAGLPCRIYFTCNPDATSWVRELIQWYLLPTGYFDPRKYGKIRFFLRINEQLYWANSKAELIKEHEGVTADDIKSFCFIPATIEDNQILLQNDKGYIANLKAQSSVECERLLKGNWNVKAEGKIFRQSEFRSYVILPRIKYKFITIDTASKTKTHNDYTVFQLWGLGEEGIYLMDQLRDKWQATELKLMFIGFVAKHQDVAAIFIEDSSAGTMLIQDLSKNIKKPVIPIQRSMGNVKNDKVSRAYIAQGYVASGYVFLNPTHHFYTEFIGEVTSFSADDSHAHDDQVDCMMDAIDKMLINPYIPHNDSVYSESFSLARKTA